ncbi:MAG: hypothetical protein U5N58_00290 [Actinomycetota bacterium]|nr:hypothetical protein [Actinomycetota bacterium]
MLLLEEISIASQLMQGKGHIVSVDISRKEIKRMKENMERLGIENIELIRG